jgi:hypothetical protein
VADVDEAAECRKLVELRDRGVLSPSVYEAQADKVLRPAVAAGHAESADRTPRRRRRLAERSNFTAVLALLRAIVFWPAGIVLGYQAGREARRTGGGSDRLALVALVIGHLAAILTIVFIILRALQ